MEKYDFDFACIDITTKCNFRCKHCFNYSGEQVRSTKELSDNEFMNIIKQLCEHNIATICICGGEPLLRVDLVYEALDYINEKRKGKTAVNMVTNGYFMTDEIACALKQRKINSVQISLDGYDAETHNWIRNNPQAFDKAINAIKIVKANNIYLGVASCPSKINYSRFFETIKLCQDLKVDMFRVQPLMLMGRGNQLKDFMLSKAEYFKLTQLIQKYKHTCKDKMVIEWGDPLLHLKFISEKNAKFDNINISSYGDILVSPYLPVRVANLRNHSLNDYLSCGLIDITKDPLIKDLCKLLVSWQDMQLNNLNKDIPIVGLDDNLDYDLIDRRESDIELLKKIIRK